MRTTLAIVTITIILLGASQLAAQNKVVVIPLFEQVPVFSTGKLYGKGRPGTKLRQHAGSTGYCTTSAGVNFALSYHFASWHDVAEVCPKDTWVCSTSDLPTSGSCDIVPQSGYSSILCDGTYGIYGQPLTALYGRTIDADANSPSQSIVVNSSALDSNTVGYICTELPVWCCWK